MLHIHENYVTISGKGGVSMDFLFRAADRYLDDSDWKDLALIKFCLCSMGVLLGCQVPQKHRSKVMAGAAAVFAVSYIPLMKKLFRIFAMQAEEEKTDRQEA